MYSPAFVLGRYINSGHNMKALPAFAVLGSYLRDCACFSQYQGPEYTNPEF